MPFRNVSAMKIIWEQVMHEQIKFCAHSFVQQLLIEIPRKCWIYVMIKTGIVPAFMELLVK